MVRGRVLSRRRLRLLRQRAALCAARRRERVATLVIIRLLEEVGLWDQLRDPIAAFGSIAAAARLLARIH